METQWHEVIIQNDEGDRSFAKAAPLMIEALQLLASLQSLPLALRTACRESELTQANDPHIVYRKALEEVRALHGTLSTVLDSVYGSFVHLQTTEFLSGQNQKQQPPSSSSHSSNNSNNNNNIDSDSDINRGMNGTNTLLRCQDGLIFPHELHMDAFLASQSAFNYKMFRLQFLRLCQLMSNVKLFSACEPRIRVLQCRYRLHRAFNGTREDQFHPTLGAGGFRHSPKLDLRRISTCMSSTTLVSFMEQLLRDEPNLFLSRHSGLGHTPKKLRAERDDVQKTKDNNNNNNNNNNNKGNEKKEEEVEEEEEEEEGRGRTLKDMADAFFGPFIQPEERYFTSDGLGLHPNYTETGERVLDLFDNGMNSSQPTVANAIPLLREFLDINGGNNGELLARLVIPMLSRIAVGENNFLQLEFTITGRISGEIHTIASWCVRSGMITAENVQLSLRIVHQPLSANDKNCTAKNMEDVLKNIFSPIWMTLLNPQAYPDMVKFLKRLVSIAVSVSVAAEVQEIPVENDPKIYSVESGIVPPDAFFIYHIWRNIQLLNCMTTTHVCFASSKKETSSTASVNSTNTTNTSNNNNNNNNNNTIDGESDAARFFLPKRSLFLHSSPIIERPLRFRLHASPTTKNSFVESVMGLLVADEVVNPVEVFSWSPLAYMYYLTQRSILLTPSRNQDVARDTVLQRAISFLVETGLNGSIATLDPLYYHASDNALHEEFISLQKSSHLTIADMTELCLHSIEGSNLSISTKHKLLGGPWDKVRARFNEFTKTQVNPLRLHFRESSLVHEMNLLCRKGLSEGGFLDSNDKEREECTSVFSRLVLGQNKLSSNTTWLIPTGMKCISLESQRKILWQFFSFPPYIIKGDPVISGRSYHFFVDRQIKYPRIVISGPIVHEKSEVARRAAQALIKRQYYKSFNVHFEPPATLLQGAEALKGLLLASQQKEKEDQEKEKEHKRNNDDNNNKGINSSYQSFSSYLSQKENIIIPTEFRCKDGVRDVIIPMKANDSTKTYFRPIPSWKEFQSDVRKLRNISAQCEMQVFAKRRLGMLECKFNLHTALTNDDRDHSTRQSSNLREKGDLYKCVKVDVHCHMAAGMTAKELLRFIKKKVQTHADDVVNVGTGTGRLITLGEMFGKLRAPKMMNTVLNIDELSVASLEVKAGKDTFNRFDEFNGRYSPLGNSTLRSLFLKTENFMGGRYFAELIRETFHRQEEDGHTFSEYRLSIYGRHYNEWDRLARWFVLHGMSHPTNRWMIQVPRLYSIYRKNNYISSFEEMLSNIFLPLWEASIHPEAHPFLNYFLAHVSGFDSVDNESEREPDGLIDIPPSQWTGRENPPFVYWVYYMWANITTLNRFRAARGLSTFSFRPHAGESGDPYHMADVFFIVDGVNHGINLKDLPVLQYLYYLTQIPLGITPLSNNALFCKYHANPFSVFFRRGLNVTLATDGALTFHHTEQPLIEEYSTAANFWSLSLADVCEIAKNSVLMSGFPSYQKKKWLGELYPLRSAAGNNVHLSKLPQTRCTFRYEVYMEELKYLQTRASIDIPLKPIMDAQLEGLYIMDTVGCTREEVIEQHLRGLTVTAAKNVQETKKETEIVRASVDRQASGMCITAPSRL